MEKNINGSDSSGVCEKLFGAITTSPAFQTIRRITSPARDRSPRASNAVKKTIDIQSKPQQSNNSVNQVFQVPIKFEHKEVLQPASITPKQTSYKAAAKIEPAPAAQVAQNKVIAIEHITHGQGAGNKEKQHTNATMKVEKAQQVKDDAEKPGGGGGGGGGVVDINDKFSAYITRAKMKIRTLSSKKIQASDHEGNDGGKDVHFSDFIDRAKNKFKSSTSNVGGTRKTSPVSFKRD